MESKLISLQQALDMVKDGQRLMIGGFIGIGTPIAITDALAQSDKKDFTVICNDTATETLGIGKLIVAKKVKKVIASHIGTNKETGRQMTQGETEVELVPQGTLAEKIRCGAYGLGGILTPTGVGTDVAVGKEVMNVEGKDYLVEAALRGDISLIYGTKVDKAGNIWFHGTTRNFNIAMAGASDVTIVLADEVVEIGELGHDDIHIPGVLVDYIVDGGAL